MNSGEGTYRPFAVLLVASALSLLGLLSVRGLNLCYAPSPQSSVLQVQVSYPDASPGVVESEVISRIEAALAGMRSCRSISSVSSRGRGSVTVSLAKGTDLQVARFEASMRIAQLWKSLPAGVNYPYLTVGSGQGKGGQMVYRLRSSIPSSRIAAYAQDHLVFPLSSLPGVERVGVSGVTPYEWVITFDQIATEALGITGLEIVSALNAYSRNEVAGLVSENGFLRTIRLSTGDGDWTNNPQEGIASVPVKKVGGRTVWLNEIAECVYQESKPEYYFRLNGLNTVTLSVDFAQDANLIVVASAVRDRMSHLESSFPEGMAADLSFDSSDYISAELRKILIRTVLCLVILLAFSFLAWRSWKQMVVLMLSLLNAILVALGLYRLSGLPVHIYTLAGITVSFGIMIDTSILMINHYGRCRDRRAFASILYAVLTTVAALLLIMLLPEEERLNLTDFLRVIIINLGVALAVCYWTVPALMDTLSYRTEPMKICTGVRLRQRARRLSRYESLLRNGLRWRRILFLLLIVSFGLPLCVIPQASKFKKEDRSLIAQIARWEPYASRRQIIDKVTGSSFGLFYQSLNRSNFYRAPERRALHIHAGMPEGCTVAQLNEVMRSMENFLAGFCEIESFMTQIHSAENGQIDVWFKKEWEQTAFPSSLKSQVISAAISFGGANWTVSGVDDNYFNNYIITDMKSDRITLKGYDFNALYSYAQDLLSFLNKHQRVSGPEIRSGEGWVHPITEVHLRYDREAMARLGLSPQQYFAALSSRLFSLPTRKVMTDGRLTDVTVRSSALESFDLWHVKSAPIPIDSLSVSLSQIGEVLKRRTEIDIGREDQAYSIQICYNFVGSYALSKKLKEEAVRYMNDEVLPVGYRAEVPGGWFETDRERYGWMIMLILAVIYVMLCVAFESFRAPLAVILMIPVSFIGLFLVFGLSNFSFDQGGFAALVMLCGITVNAGIYLVSERDSLPGHGDPVHRYVRAFSRKIGPIILTLVSTVLGLIPFLSDGPSEVFWFDFSIGTISGLAFSVFAILIYLPIVLLFNKTKKT